MASPCVNVSEQDEGGACGQGERLDDFHVGLLEGWAEGMALPRPKGLGYL
jgi:hypothetical protein